MKRWRIPDESSRAFRAGLLIGQVLGVLVLGTCAGLVLAGVLKLLGV